MYEETRKVYAQVRNEQKEKSAQVKAAMKALEPFNAQIDKLKEELKSLGEQLRVQVWKYTQIMLLLYCSVRC